MNDLQEKIEKVRAQQKACVVTSFTNAEAFDLGYYIYQKALREGKPFVVSVTRNRKRLFYAACEGTSVENDAWILRKENMAYYAEKASYEMALQMQQKSTDITARFGLPKDQYVAAGGSMPITAEGIGMIGTATVSGMSQAEDHEFVTEGILEWIASKG